MNGIVGPKIVITAIHGLLVILRFIRFFTVSKPGKRLKVNSTERHAELLHSK